MKKHKQQDYKATCYQQHPDMNPGLAFQTGKKAGGRNGVKDAFFH